MLTNDVHFDDMTWSLGRNGMIKTTGVGVIRRSISTIELRPVTSKGYIGKCLIGIPINKVTEVCTAMGSDLIGKILDSLNKNDYVRLLGISPILDNEISHRLKGD